MGGLWYFINIYLWYFFDTPTWGDYIYDCTWYGINFTIHVGRFFVCFYISYWCGKSVYQMIWRFENWLVGEVHFRNINWNWFNELGIIHRCLISYTPWLNGGIQLLVIPLIIWKNTTYYIYVLVVWNWNDYLLHSTPIFYF